MASTELKDLDAQRPLVSGQVVPIQAWVVAVYVVAGVVGVILGSIGLNSVLQSKFAGGAFATLEVKQTLGFLAWQYLFPAALALFFTASLALLRHPGNPLPGKVSVAAAMLAGGLTVLIVGIFLAREVLSCGVVFCFLADPDLPGIGAGGGLGGAMGLWLCLLGLALSSSCAVILARLLIPGQRAPPSSTTFADRARARRSCRALSASLLAVLILPGCLMLTAILPNNFQKIHVRDGGAGTRLPNVMREHGSQPQDEVNGAAFVTMYVEVSQDLTLKFYPDTLIFYGCLEAIVLVALIAAWVPSLAQFCSKRRPGSFSIGETGVMGVILLLTILWTVYWSCQHLYEGGKWNAPTTEIVARTFGQEAILFMSLALLPASRNSLWIKALGVSWEATLWGHRWMGGLSLVMIVCHFLSYWVRFAQLHYLPHDLWNLHTYFPWNGHDPYVKHIGDNITLPLIQFVAYPAVILMGLLPLVRRQNYEAFRYAHYIFMALIPVVLLHAHSGWFFLLGGTAFWLADASVRLVRGALPSRLTAVTAFNAEGGITELRFDKAFEEPGMYCFINVPQVSHWQWHPFSLSSSPLDGWAQMNIKNMGAGTFTGDLHALAKAHNGCEGLPFSLNVDGPYGQALELESHSTLLLLAGGIGITPMHSILAYTLQLAELNQLPPGLRHVRLLWTSRDAELFSVFSETLTKAVSASTPQLRFTVSLHLTGGAACGAWASGIRPSPIACLPVTEGRPNFEDIYRGMREDDEGTVLVKVCAPAAMDKSAALAARSCSWITYESEGFVM